MFPNIDTGNKKHLNKNNVINKIREIIKFFVFILFQSLHLGLVGNPFGPAGTGKTESVKALGGLVGRLVLVFNCDEVISKVYSKLETTYLIQ